MSAAIRSPSHAELKRETTKARRRMITQGLEYWTLVFERIAACMRQVTCPHVVCGSGLRVTLKDSADANGCVPFSAVELTSNMCCVRDIAVEAVELGVSKGARAPQLVQDSLPSTGLMDSSVTASSWSLSSPSMRWAEAPGVWIVLRCRSGPLKLYSRLRSTQQSPSTSAKDPCASLLT